MENRNFTNGHMKLVYIMYLNGYSIFYRKDNRTYVAGYGTCYNHETCQWSHGRYDFGTLESVIKNIESN